MKPNARATSQVERRSSMTGKRTARIRQTGFAFDSRGGARKGAGRKPKGPRAGIPHRSRAEHAASHPVQTTTRLRAGLPSLRRAREFVVLRRAIEAASARPEFRVVHHSIQSNHLHLIVEAKNRAALSMGLRALLVRIARALNRLWARCGSIFADRFHERALRTPTEVRNSLVYVLQNARKHGILAQGPDPYSSGPWFDGWSGGVEFRAALEGQRRKIEVHARSLWARITGAAASPARAKHPPTEVAGTAAPGAGLDAEGFGAGPNPRTWLMRIGWQRKGLLDPEERPQSARSGRTRAL